MKIMRRRKGMKKERWREMKLRGKGRGLGEGWQRRDRGWDRQSISTEP